MEVEEEAAAGRQKTYAVRERDAEYGSNFGRA